jgi:hypothetical protein
MSLELFTLRFIGEEESFGAVIGNHLKPYRREKCPTSNSV